MSNSSQRRFQMKYAHVTAVVVGIFIALVGIYFIAVIRGETDKRNAKCTERTTGVVAEVKESDSKYQSTIEYEAEDIDCSVSVITKNALTVGTELEVYYEPLTPKHFYIEGITQTGKSNVVEGLIMISVGVVFVVVGRLMKKLK